jgi:RNA polymerase sigma factor (sigma-70 family)
MVVISDINEKARGKVRELYESAEVRDRLWGLDQYLKFARQIIARFAIGSVRTQMLNDEDAIAFIAEHLITGAIRFDATKGRSTIKSYLNQCGLWAINRWLTNMKAANKIKVTSLDVERPNFHGGEAMMTRDIIPDDAPTSVEAIIANETMEEILNHPCLNETQRQCLRYKFVDEMTYREIGLKINKTGARVEQITKEALRKLNAELEV